MNTRTHSIAFAFVACMCTGEGNAQHAQINQVPMVNPLTGTPLVIEHRQRRLEELKLETQMLEEQAKQAEIRARMGGAANLPPVNSLSPKPVVPVFPAPETASVAPKKTSVTLKSVRKSSADIPVRFVPSAQSAMNIAPLVQVTAIFRSGERRRAVVRFNGELYTVGEGDLIAGNTVTSISEINVVIGDNTYKLERRAAFVAVGTPQDAANDARRASVNLSQPREGAAWPLDIRSGSAAVAIEGPFAVGSNVAGPLGAPLLPTP